MMDIKPIHTEEDYDAALNEIENLFSAEPNTPEGDKLEILVTLVKAYENKYYSIPAPDPIEAIEYHMERLGLTRKDLEIYIGGAPRVSEILNRKRPLNLRMIRGLSAGLGIPIDILAQTYELSETEIEFAGYFPFFVGIPLVEFRSKNSAEHTLLAKSPLANINQFFAKPNYQTIESSDVIREQEFIFAGNTLNATERTIQ